MRNITLILMASIAGSQLACASSPEPASDAEFGSNQVALVDNQTVLGFESLAGWTASAGTVAQSTLTTQGSHSLALYRFSYSQLTSVPMAVGAMANTVSLDLQIPVLQPNPYWYGYIQLLLSAPSRGINNRYIDQKDLMTLTPGRYGRVDFSVPADLRGLLAQGASDLTVSLVLNVPAGVGVYLFDNLVLGALPAQPSVQLPHMIEYCDVEPCSSTPPAAVKICPIANPNCTTNYHTSVVMQVNGRPVSGGFVYFPWSPRQDTLVIQAGAESPTFPTSMMTFHGPRIELDSYTNEGVPITYYKVAPVWGGVTTVNFEATTSSNDQVDAVFFRHVSYDTGSAFPDLFTAATQATLAAQNVTGVTGVRPVSLFCPAEFAYGDGNWWDGRVNVNYGNPPWIDGLGGIPTGLVTYALQEYTHEYTHALFDQVAGAFGPDSSCINEGLANAVDVLVGTAPPSKLGPATNAVPSGSFEGDCTPLTDPHDVGNCYFYHVYKAGMPTDAFVRNVFHSQHRYTASACHPSTELTNVTGDSLIVLFTEASGGTDMTSVVNQMQLRNSGSYSAAKAALGF